MSHPYENATSGGDKGNSMSEPIKGCPQPDAPELVMRADGYHYRTEDEMRELTDEQIENVWAGASSPVEDTIDMIDYARSVIAAHTALNAADRDVMRQALEEIAMAGMSPSPKMSPDGVRSWHASRAWEFIGIAAHALAAASAPPVEQQEVRGPLAYLTRNEEGAPAMLFFDVAEAGKYCGENEEPEPLYTHPSPSLAELRAKVEALHGMGLWLYRADVLAEIDRLGDKS